VYREVQAWLEKYLAKRLPGAQLHVFDTHGTALSSFIRRRGLDRYFTSRVWETYSLSVDVMALVIQDGHAELVFVRCRNGAITLRDLSQFWGLSRIARPLMAFLVSPVGARGSLRSLVNVYGRTDVLEYDWPKGKMARSIVVARWNEASRDLDMTSVLPPGAMGNQPW
jgi:hypothetical protein